MYVFCTAVNVVYRCNCCVPVFSVLPVRIKLSSYHCMCICCYSVCVAYSIIFFLFIVHCCVVPLTSVPLTTHPHTTHTCTKTGCATTVGCLLIMTTVGKTHTAKKQHWLNHTLLNNCLKKSGVSKIIRKATKNSAQSSPRKNLIA